MTTDSRSIEQTAAEWLARRDGGTWDAADQTALAQWLGQATTHRVAFLRLQAAWEEAGRLRVLADGTAHHAPPPDDRRAQMLRDLPPRVRVPARARRLPRWLAAAALAVVTLLASRDFQPRTTADVASYRTVMGEVRTQPLADGSRAILASDSRIDVRLSPTRRDVALARGEAIFEVAKDRHRPFIVAANGYRAVAVGTRYSVQRDAAGLRVVVTEGTVRLESPDRGATAQPSVLLPAGSVALVRGNGVLVRSLALDDAQQLLDWRDGLLVFRDTPLTDVVREFNRYNARKLVVADDATGALRVGGSFRWDNQEGFVRLLEAGFPVRAEAGPDRILLRAR